MSLSQKMEKGQAWGICGGISLEFLRILLSKIAENWLKESPMSDPWDPILGLGSLGPHLGFGVSFSGSQFGFGFLPWDPPLDLGFPL